MLRFLAAVVYSALMTSVFVGQGFSQTPQTQAALPPPWEAANTPPDVQLALRETNREKVRGETWVTYQMRASKFPTGKTYALWGWPFGSLPGPLATFVTDPAGTLLTEKERHGLDRWDFVAARYAKGEPFRLAMISTDQSVKAFVTAIPFPIEAKNGTCRLWIELASTRGDAFAVHGEGFVPGEDVYTSSRFDGEGVGGQVVAGDDGSLPVVIVHPEGAVTSSGTATYVAAGKACAPTLRYEWGPPAMKVQ